MYLITGATGGIGFEIAAEAAAAGAIVAVHGSRSETVTDAIDTAARRAGLGLPSPQDIAPLVLFLCGPGAAKITGQVISVNGGLNA